MSGGEQGDRHEARIQRGAPASQASGASAPSERDGREQAERTTQVRHGRRRGRAAARASARARAVAWSAAHKSVVPSAASTTVSPAPTPARNAPSASKGAAA